MSKTALSRLLSVLYIVALVMGLGCSRDRETEARVDKSATANEPEPVDKSRRSGEEVLIDDDVGRTLEQRIDEASKIAGQVYDESSTQIKTLLDDADAQANTALCATYRIERLLNNRSERFYQSDANGFLRRLEQVLSRQTFVNIHREVHSYGGTQRVDINLLMPLAKPYRVEKQFVARFYSEPGRSSFNVHFEMDPSEVCDAQFSAPIPNFRQPREFEASNLAKMLVRSIRRLDRLGPRLRSLEDNASRASSLILILGQMKKDLKFDVADPATARLRLQSHEKDLKRAISIMRGASPEAKESYLVKHDEVKQVLEIFKK